MKRPNVVLITIDTLRADHLSCYGYHRSTSPNIDQIAGEGILFETAIAQAPWTLPSVASILTSKYPKELGMIHRDSKFHDNSLRAAEIFKKKNYDTAAFVSGGAYLTKERGFNKGVNIFKDIPGRAVNINKHAVEWLDKKRSKPFFLWVHYFDVHSDYDAPSPFNKQFDNKMPSLDLGRTDFLLKIVNGDIKTTPAMIEKIKLLYDREIAYTDYHIGLLLNKLREKNLMEDTIIVIASDHGEGFMEHGRVLHVVTLYEELVHVPLIIRYPKKLPAGKRISTIVQNVDILPTLLDLSLSEKNYQFSGNSLIPLIEGNESKENVGFSHVNMMSHEKFFVDLKKSIFNTLFMVRTNEDKLIFNQTNNNYELYNLEKDPGEKNNIYSENKNSKNNLETKLADWIEFLEKKSVPPQEIELEQEAIDRLKALGYIQ